MRTLIAIGFIMAMVGISAMSASCLIKSYIKETSVQNLMTIGIGLTLGGLAMVFIGGNI